MEGRKEGCRSRLNTVIAGIIIYNEKCINTCLSTAVDDLDQSGGYKQRGQTNGRGGALAG